MPYCLAARAASEDLRGLPVAKMRVGGLGLVEFVIWVDYNIGGDD